MNESAFDAHGRERQSPPTTERGSVLSVPKKPLTAVFPCGSTMDATIVAPVSVKMMSPFAPAFPCFVWIVFTNGFSGSAAVVVGKMVGVCGKLWNRDRAVD